MNCHISFKCSPNLLVLHSFPTRRSSDLTRPRPLAFGAARTLLGIIAGVSYATMLGKFGVNRSEVWYYVNLPELRLSIRTSRGRIEYEGGEILRAFKKLSRFAYTLDIE